MIRVVIYLVIVGLLALAAVWVADRPGDVAITWQGRRIETSVLVLMAAFAAVAVLAVMLWSIVRAVLRSPDALSLYLRTRRGVRGYLAVSQGLVAVGSGDFRAARKFADEAARSAPDEPLTLLLSAQTAQLSGDREGAARTFQLMAGRPDTKLLGLHGLFIEARRRSDPAAALIYAEAAASHASAPGTIPAWAGQAVLEFRCAAGDWSGALERLERNAKSGLIDKPAHRRQRAVLLTAQALAAEDGVSLPTSGKPDVSLPTSGKPDVSLPTSGRPDVGHDRDRAKALVLEAVKLAPDLVPAAALAGRLLGEAGETRKASRIIEAAWLVNPHPDLADAYAHLRPGSSARERLGRVETLAAKAPGNVEAALAVARAALDAQEFATAREALKPLAIVPTRRVAALMAELEEMEHGDEGRAREWMTRALNARRDPAWTADGFVSERWQPVSPVTGRLDAFEWKDPLAGAQAGVLLEAEQRGVFEVPHEPQAQSASSPTEPEPARVPQQTESWGGGTESSSEPRRPAASSSALAGEERTEFAAPSSQEEPPLEARPRRGRSLTPVAIAPAVIPLVHAPDDPGPDAEPHIEPAPEPTAEPPSDNWSRIRQLFKQ